MYTYAETLKDRKHKCRNCGRVFEVPFYCTEWGYWYAGVICCGYTCMMAMRRKDRDKLSGFGEKPPTPRAPLTRDEIESAENMILRGYSNEKVAMKIGRSKSAVANIRKRMVNEGRWTTTR